MFNKTVIHIMLLACGLGLAGCGGRATAPAIPVDGAPPPARVERCLDRAITMASVLHRYPWAVRQWSANLDLIEDLQPTLVGRAALVWGWEHLMLRSLSGVNHRVDRIHDRVPDAVVQGCIFEFVSTDIERVTVPAHVLAAFDLDAVERTYDFAAMLPSDGEPDFWPGWDEQAAVPDVTRLETQLWFYHLATLYIDAGLEAIHLGALERMAVHDRGLAATERLLQRIREYAALHARRGWILLDAHTHGLVRQGRLLLDFHSWPLRPREVGAPELEDVVLETGFLDGIYGRSRGGVTPGGQVVEHQRFLVELDNGYAGPTSGGCELPECVWGSDEITWFARQPAPRRDELLRRFWVRVPQLDPQGRFQVPGVRPLQSMLATACEHYLVHRAGSLGCAGDQQDTVRELWGPAPAGD